MFRLPAYSIFFLGFIRRAGFIFCSLRFVVYFGSDSYEVGWFFACLVVTERFFGSFFVTGLVFRYYPRVRAVNSGLWFCAREYFALDGGC